MPLTPFIGISTFIHLAVIGWNKVRELLFKKDASSAAARSSKDNCFLTLAVGSAIIFIIFSFVLISAGFLIYSSSAEAHATAHILPEAAAAAGVFADSLQPEIHRFQMNFTVNVSELLVVGLTLLATLVLFLIPRFPYKYVANSGKREEE